jgi:hypothetical protein
MNIDPQSVQFLIDRAVNDLKGRNGANITVLIDTYDLALVLNKAINEYVKQFDVEAETYCLQDAFGVTLRKGNK